MKKEIPEELTTPIIIPRELVNPVYELGPTAPYDGAPAGSYNYTHDKHTKYWDAVAAEQQRRFGILLDHMGRGLTLDSPSSDFRWKGLAQQLAEMHFPGLRAPDPFKPRPRDGKKALLLAVAREHEKATPKQITDKRALELLKKSGSHNSLATAKRRYKVPPEADPWWKWVIENIES
jgi:hypothetical protein